MQILILCGIYAVELFCYQLGLRILFEVRLKTKVWMFVGLVLPVLIGVMAVDASGKNVLVSFVVIAVTFLTVEGRVLEKGVRIALVMLILACADDIYSYTCISNTIFGNLYYDNASYFQIKCLTAVTVLFLLHVKIKIFQYKKIHIGSIIYLILGSIVALMMCCLAMLNYAKEFLKNSNFSVFCNILDVTIYIGIFLLVIFIVYIKNTHERMERLLETEQLMKESQVNYYKQLLKKESETRKYRHDMVNHLVYLQEVLKNNQVENARKYVEDILGGFKRIQNTYYVTGNEMVDTIMNYFLGMLPESVHIEIHGKYPIELAMEEIDICTIFSNVFQNAVEEIIENPIQEAAVQVEVIKGKQYVEYKIKNSIYTDIVIGRNGLPKSGKADKKNHGIGMGNVKETIERNEGRFQWCQKEGYFCVTLTLPIKNITA